MASLIGSCSKRAGIQLEVLGLYRKLLRAAGERNEIKTVIRSEFISNASLNRKEVMKIQWLLRKGQRQLDLLSSPHIKTATLINSPQ